VAQVTQRGGVPSLHTPEVRGWALSTDGAVGVPVHCRGVGLVGLWGSLPTQIILWFYDSVLSWQSFSAVTPGKSDLGTGWDSNGDARWGSLSMLLSVVFEAVVAESCIFMCMKARSQRSLLERLRQQGWTEIWKGLFLPLYIWPKAQLVIAEKALGAEMKRGHLPFFASCTALSQRGVGIRAYDGRYLYVVLMKACNDHWWDVIIEKNHRKAWDEKDNNAHLVSTPLPRAGSPTSRPGCPEPHPAWPWMHPEMGHLLAQTTWGTLALKPGDLVCPHVRYRPALWYPPRSLSRSRKPFSQISPSFRDVKGFSPNAICQQHFHRASASTFLCHKPACWSIVYSALYIHGSWVILLPLSGILPPIHYRESKTLQSHWS